MKIYFYIAILLLSTLLVGFFYGYFTHRNKIFPYRLITKAYMQRIYNKNMQFTIGIYEGTTPFNLTDTEEVDNPVISAGDVRDVEAAFVADPFMLMRNGEYFMFFEVLNMDNFSGDIGYATSHDGKNWGYRKIILNEPFHLSYPRVYEWNGDYYMIPESSEDFSVRIYRAVSFPEKWEYLGNLLSGSPIVDATAFFYNSKWWMFTSTTGNDVLNLYYSDSLTSGWQAHPMNPILENNKHLARPAGSVFEFENRLYRLAQDVYPYYGIQVYAVEIAEITTSIYKENIDSPILVVSKSGKGWNAAGMHHVDLHRVNNKWRAVVDGLKKHPGNK